MSTNGLIKSLMGRVRRNTSPIDSQEDPAIFAARFLRCYRPLLFIGRRVLGGPEGVEAAIDNCWFVASHNPPRFEAEGAFRSWLLRVLIDEALAILRKNRAAKVLQEVSQMRAIATPMYATDKLPKSRQKRRTRREERVVEIYFGVLTFVILAMIIWIGAYAIFTVIPEWQKSLSSRDHFQHLDLGPHSSEFK